MDVRRGHRWARSHCSGTTRRSLKIDQIPGQISGRKDIGMVPLVSGARPKVMPHTRAHQVIRKMPLQCNRDEDYGRWVMVRRKIHPKTEI